MGGKCFNGLSRINKEDIQPTIILLENMLGMYLRSSFLGSVGKKATSGDIDIGIDSSKVKPAELKSKLIDCLGESEVRQVGKLLTIRFPIYKKSEKVQIDFLFGDINWLKMFYHSSSTSDYSGAHRNGAIRALLRVVNAKYVHENGKLVKKEKLQWSPQSGLCWVTQTLNKDKKTGEYGKTWKTKVNSVVELNKIPSVLFSKNANFYSLDSLETIIEAVDKYYKEQSERIFQEIAKEFESMTFDIDYKYPEQVQKYIRV